jgi:hypothetical protein
MSDAEKLVWALAALRGPGAIFRQMIVLASVAIGLVLALTLVAVFEEQQPRPRRGRDPNGPSTPICVAATDLGADLDRGLG